MFSERLQRQQRPGPAHPQAASARQALNGGGAALAQGRRALAKGQLGGELAELWDPTHVEVLLQVQYTVQEENQAPARTGT